MRATEEEGRAIEASLKRQDEFFRQEPCRVCGEVSTLDGHTCPRCEASLEEDRLNRETYGG